jgi:predicted AlkP superfamily phosphohydrolase/phosphomutase
MDRTTGALIDAWPEADVMVVSDHGAGPLWGDVNLGAWLNGRGRARYKAASRSPLLRVAWAMPPWVRRLGRRAAPGLARRALGATLTGQLGPFEWGQTDAFCGLHGDLWLNLRGREPRGTLGPEAAEQLRAELAEALLELRDPSTGRRLFAAAYRREALYQGPAEHLAPDLMLDSWSEGYRVSPNRGPSQLVTAPLALAGVREPWSADHRPLGIFVASGARIAPGTADELSLYDVCPTALALLERPIPTRLDGRVAEAALDRSWLRRHPVVTRGRVEGRVRDGAYSDDEAEAVAAHLKDLGYIE